MIKWFTLALAAAALSISQSRPVAPALAGTCANNCAPTPIRFTPGQAIRVQAVNRSASIIYVEQIAQIDPYPLLPGQTLELAIGEGTQPNLAMRFVDATELPLKVVTSQPQSNILKLDFYTGGRPPGDRALYVQDDGSLLIQ